MLLNSTDLVVDNRQAASFALSVYQSTAADFGDALIAYSSARAGCSETITFDEKAAQHTGMRLL